ncbi:hypothetical protein [Agromyces sp. M3QZ16-3]|uniref:hypothetical protein n=1 Tax=Agromyces sp. M3QZ16-3 TaxID=3447585 RepID=UPI003F691E9A
MILFDDEWIAAVTKECDPVFDAADVGFVRQVGHGPDQQARYILWEATPALFAAKYPESRIIEEYGENQWPKVHCIDYWVYLNEPEQDQCRLSFEGWWGEDVIVIDLTGNGTADGKAIAAEYARILKVAPVTPPNDEITV